MSTFSNVFSCGFIPTLPVYSCEAGHVGRNFRVDPLSLNPLDFGLDMIHDAYFYLSRPIFYFFGAVSGVHKRNNITYDHYPGTKYHINRAA